MPKRIKKIANKIGNAVKNVAKVVSGPTKQIIGQLLPHLEKALLAKMISGAGALTGLPFRESGMMAAATPMGTSGLRGIQVSAPSANGKITQTSGPRQRSLPNGNSIVTHREYVTDINLVEQGFDLQFQFGINPGNQSLFPWLSQIASRYELYKFRSLRFVYEPQCGTSSTGTVFIAVDFDASDLPPENKTQMMSYKNAVRSPLWFASSYVASTQDLTRLKTNYVLSGAAPPGTDIKTYDIGNLFVAIQSDSSTDQSAGELYVEYTVELITPQINNDVISATLLDTNWDEERLPFTPPPPDITNPIVELGGLVVRSDILDVGAGTSNIYIGQQGYYFVYVNLGVASMNDGNFSLAQQQGNESLLFNSMVTNNGSVDPQSYLMEAVAMVQVVNPEEPALIMTIENTDSISGNTTAAMIVTPISQACLLGITGQPVVPAINPRARLGRIRPYPAVSSTLSSSSSLTTKTTTTSSFATKLRRQQNKANTLGKGVSTVGRSKQGSEELTTPPLTAVLDEQ